MSEWHPVQSAPHDGTPVILWIKDVTAPPTFPVTVGVWATDELQGMSFWHVFAPKDGTTFYFDEHILGWMPLPNAG